MDWHFARLPAVPVIFICMAAWLTCTLFFTSAIINLPYFGTVVATNDGNPGLIMRSVRPGSPAAIAGVMPGDIVKAIRPVGADTRLELPDTAGIHDRSETSSYTRWTLALQTKSDIWEQISGGDIVLELQDKRQLEVSALDRRPWGSLPVEYWINAIHSLAVLVISAGMAAFAPPSSSIRLMFLSGFCLSLNILCHALKSIEEITFSPVLTELIYGTSNFSAVLFAYALLAMLWHTPGRLNRFPFATLSIGFALFAFATQQFQWFAFPVHPFQFPYLLAIIVSLALIGRKWFLASGNPIDRATLSWVLLSILAGVIPWIIVYSLPIVMSGKPILTPNLAGVILTVIFFGFALGALRFRLFGIRAIWLRSLAWLSVGIGVVLLDLILLTQFNWAHSQAFPTAIMLVSWGYFPVKNFLFNKLANRPAMSFEDAGMKLFNHLVSIRDLAEFNGHFIGFLKRLYQVRDVDMRVGGNLGQMAILDNGLCLSVPAILGDSTYVLQGRNMGQRLFSGDDRKLAGVLSELAGGIYRQLSVEFEKRETDRAQIVRDLHDDVGAKLLDLIYAADGDGRIRAHAHDAMKALKDSFMTIEDFEDLDLYSSWQQTWANQEERLVSAGFDPVFTTNFIGARIIGARDLVNAKRIVEEHVSNILKYATKDVAVNGTARLLATGEFVVEISSGKSDDKKVTSDSGRGFANMKARAKESAALLTLGADEAEPSRFRFSFRLPFSE